MSAARRGVDGPPRLVCIDKPAGPSSFQVVGAVRRITGYRRVGHGGTLDPFATGLLVVGLGAATRLMRFVSEGDKVYEATLHFGSETDSEDATGVIVRSTENLPDEAGLRSVLDGFTGRIQQVPPRISAVHVAGERSYRRARRGEEFEIPAREVTVHAIEVLEFAGVRVRLRVRCGTGTYIRALARDIGRRLDSAAHLETLRRTASGALDLGRAIGLDEFGARWEGGERGLSPATLFSGWPALELDPERVQRIRHGAQPDPGWFRAAGWDTLPERVALLDQRSELVAVALRDGEQPPRLALVLPEVE